MKKIIFFNLIIVFLLTSCSNVKEVQNNVLSGNYDKAIDLSIEQIVKKKGKKSADPYVKLLKESYDKATSRDLAEINRLKKDANPEKWQKIYDLYLDLDTRQDKIKPLLPLSLIKEKKQVEFAIKDYSNDIIDAKKHFVDHLYRKANILLSSNNKADIRKAYEVLDELDRIDPNYKDVRQMMSQAHQKGMTYALVKIINETNKIIPTKLEEELLNFSSYGASNFWVDYHNKQQVGKTYDYTINLRFKQINITPDQIREKEIIEEKEIQDGYTYKHDANGNVVKDSLGNPIKTPRYVKVRSKVHLYNQHKEAQVQAIAEIIDNRTGQRIDNFPLQSQFIFDYTYATQEGDKRAIRKEILDFLDKQQVPFPTNEQMIYDAAQDIKMQFKDILSGAEFL